MPNEAPNLESWFQGRPKWIQDAARRILVGGDIEDKNLKELLVLCKREAGVPDGQSPELKPLPIPKGILQATEAYVPVIIASISDPQGINALSPRNPLEFGDAGLTIVYGRNASGKSGYVRFLKHACGVKQRGVLHGDVFKAVNAKQGCTIKYRIADETREFNWSPGASAPEELRAVQVYDNACANVYVNQESEVTYEPGILSLFTKS